MDDAERDAFYDELIAPKLAEIAGECADHGISFVAAADTGSVLNETCRYADGWSFAFKLVQLAAHAAGNVDRLMIDLVRYANEYGGGAENSWSIAVRKFVGKW